MSAQLWSAISALLGALGVTFEPTPAVKAVISAAAALVIAVVQWQHHKTIRNADTAAAAALTARAGADKAAAERPVHAGGTGALVELTRRDVRALHDKIDGMSAAIGQIRNVTGADPAAPAAVTSAEWDAAPLGSSLATNLDTGEQQIIPPAAPVSVGEFLAGSRGGVSMAGGALQAVPSGIGGTAPAAAPPATSRAGAPVPATDSLTPTGPSGYAPEHD